MSKEVEILYNALFKAGKYARRYLPAEMPDDFNYASIYAGGDYRDPEGMEFINYWIDLAIAENKRYEEEEE